MGRPVFLTHCFTKTLHPKCRKSKCLSKAPTAFWTLASAQHPASSPLLTPTGPQPTNCYNLVEERENNQERRKEISYHIPTEKDGHLQKSVQSVKSGFKSKQEAKRAHHPLVQITVPSSLLSKILSRPQYLAKDSSLPIYFYFPELFTAHIDTDQLFPERPCE